MSTDSSALARDGLFALDPLADRRWPEFVARHPRSSIYHSQSWLAALSGTYGYRPVVYTTSPPGSELRNGLAFCQVESWLTGRRAVSLPFSDHCELLVDCQYELEHLVSSLLRNSSIESWRYIELRPLQTHGAVLHDLNPGPSYCTHSLNLTPMESELFTNFHKDCIQRKIKRADREGLEYREGSSPELLAMFYSIYVPSRRRQGIPPQPWMWFINLAEGFGPAMRVRLALYRGRPAASMITIHNKRCMVYKYGCSVPELSNLGGTPWLFWKAMQEAKSLELRELDLGRSDWDNRGLIVFKDRLGAKRNRLTYLKYPPATCKPKGVRWRRQLAGQILRHMPAPLLRAAGTILYRHFG